jgi:PAS domain-containing protein
VPYRSVTHEGVTLLCFPPYDVVFARLAAERLAALPTKDPDALQTDLRATFADATVRRREPLASLGRGEAWYAYRDGRYSPFTDAAPWWEAPDVARFEIDAGGRYVGANEAALALIGVDAEGLREIRSGDLTDAATRPTVPWLWQLLQDVGVLHSTSRLVTPDGRKVPVEYRLLLDAAGPGRHVSFVRVVPLEAVEPSPEIAET